MSKLIDVLSAFNGSDGEATMAIFAQLRQCGPAGLLGIELYRAVKSSVRAKKYRGKPGRGQPTYRAMAYDRKNWAMENAIKALTQHAGALGISWGWGHDAKAVNFEHVLYIELPTGQISMHTGARLSGPDFPGVWDEARDATAGRLCGWIARVLEPGLGLPMETTDVRN